MSRVVICLLFTCLLVAGAVWPVAASGSEPAPGEGVTVLLHLPYAYDANGGRGYAITRTGLLYRNEYDGEGLLTKVQSDCTAAIALDNYYCDGGPSAGDGEYHDSVEPFIDFNFQRGAIDFDMPFNAAVLSASDGTVQGSPLGCAQGGDGTVDILLNGDDPTREVDILVRYLHLNSVDLASVADGVVQTGDPIGTAGTCGGVPAHLHLAALYRLPTNESYEVEIRFLDADVRRFQAEGVPLPKRSTVTGIFTYRADAPVAQPVYTPPLQFRTEVRVTEGTVVFHHDESAPEATTTIGSTPLWTVNVPFAVGTIRQAPRNWATTYPAMVNGTAWWYVQLPDGRAGWIPETAMTPFVSAPSAVESRTRVTVASNGTQGNQNAGFAVLSLDGRFVGFSSSASNLVTGDTNGKQDVFVRDVVAGTTTRVSVASSGGSANGNSQGGWLSADGQRVVFDSVAKNLVPQDTNQRSDVFVRDLTTETTTRISLLNGAQLTADAFASNISADGRYALFCVRIFPPYSYSETYIYDLNTGTVTLAAQRDGGGGGGWAAGCGSIAANGRFVVFAASGADWVADDTNGKQDVFVHDLETLDTERVSLGGSGSTGTGTIQANNNVHAGIPGAAISADGRFVVFDSPATNLVDGDTNGKYDVFVRDRTLGTTHRVSISSLGDQGDGNSTSPSISPDGRYIAYQSSATNLDEAGPDTNLIEDVYVFDQLTRRTVRVSTGIDPYQPDARSDTSFFSADNQLLLFGSAASNLVVGDTNNSWDTFLQSLP